MTTIVLSTVGAGTWTVPADWNSSNNSFQLIAGGGGGGWLAGGGGGEFAATSNVALTPGAVINYSVGAGGTGAKVNQFNNAPTASAQSGGNTWFNTTSFIRANGGQGSQYNGTVYTGGAGGTGGVGTTRFDGGAGGNPSPDTAIAGGGGGAGGPFGAGGRGANGDGGGQYFWGGGGGGGNGGGAPGQEATSSVGGVGGGNYFGSGAGAGGTLSAISGAPGVAGGGGGGGYGDMASSNSGDGGAGGNGADLGTVGSGGGGGAAGYAANATGTPGLGGGNGGLYGAGGGGGGNTNNFGASSGGNGAPGIIVITYSPSGTNASVAISGVHATGVARAGAIRGGEFSPEFSSEFDAAVVLGLPAVAVVATGVHGTGLVRSVTTTLGANQRSVHIGGVYGVGVVGGVHETGALEDAGISLVGSELVMYGCLEMPDGDGMPIGGSIDITTTVVFSDITPNGAVTYCSPTGSTVACVVTTVGFDPTGALQTESRALGSGGNFSQGSQTYERLMKATITNLTGVGDVAVQQSIPTVSGNVVSAQQATTSAAATMTLQSGQGAQCSTGMVVRITNGTPAGIGGTLRRIVGISGDVIAVDRPWVEVPTSGTQYSVAHGMIFASQPNQVTQVRRPFYNVTADAAGGVTRVYYEKVFLVNNSPTTDITGVSVGRNVDPATGGFDIALATALNDDIDTVNRQTAPRTGITAFTSGASPQFISSPSGTLPHGIAPNVLGAQGVWLRLTLPPGTAATKETCFTRVIGTIP